MWKDKLWYTVPTVVAVVVSQYGCKSTSTISSENLPPPTKTTDEKDAIATETFESFTKSHPEYKGRQKDTVVINFNVNGVGTDTIAIKSTDEEKAEINSFEYKIEGKTVTPYEGAIVWTEKRNADGSKEWVRLAGVQFKTDEETIITSWYYSPDAFDKKLGQEAEFTKVFAFNSKDDEYVFYPLINPPTDILWSDDLTVTNASEYQPWDGIQPFTLPTGSIPEGPGKSGLMSLVDIEVTSAEFNNAQEEIAKSEIYTLTPNGIEVKTEEGIAKIVEDIKPNVNNGTFIITIDGEEYIAILNTVNEQSLTFVDINGKIFIVSGDRLIDIPPLPEEIVKLQKNMDGTNYSFSWNNDLKSITLTYTNPESGETSVIPEIVFDEKGNWKRTYTFETPYGTQAEVTIDSRVDKMTVTETPEGKKILDFSAWSLIDGEWVREIEQGEPQLNVSEAQQILIENGSENPDDRPYSLQAILDYTNAVFPGQVGRYEGTIRYNEYKGVIKATTANSRWLDKEIKTLDENNKPKFIKTTSYAILNFTNKKSAMIYKDKNREFQIVFIDADLNDWGNWSPYY